MITIALIAIFSFVTYRLTRLFVLDEWIEEARNWYLRKVLSPLPEHEQDHVLDEVSGAPLVRLPMWRRKLYTLLTCPYCSSAYFAAGVLAAHRIFVGPFAVPVWVWLASWTGSLMIYNYMDSED